MICDTHDARQPCPYCEWAASGDPVKVRSAAGRAARVAGKPSESPPKPSEPNPSATPKSSPRFRWVKAMKLCGARVRVGCGCNGEIYCRARELARVTPEDCRVCLQTRTPGAEAPGVPSTHPPPGE